MLTSRIIVGLAALVAMTGVAFAQVNGPNAAAPPQLGPGGTTFGQGLLHAFINANGTIALGDGTLSSSKLAGLGTYDVRFRRNIRTCAMLATAGLAGFSGSIPATIVTLVGRVGTTNGVFVQTFDAAGALVDRGFNLVIKC